MSLNSTDSDMILDIWLTVRDSVPPASREDVALRLLKNFDDYGVGVSRLVLEGEDKYMDGALDLFFDEDQVDEHEEESEDDDYY